MVFKSISANNPLGIYRRRIFMIAVVYSLSCFAVPALISGHYVSGAAIYAVAVIPAIAIMGFFWAIGRLIVETKDEYQRLLYVKAVLWTTTGCMALTSLWGFLEAYTHLGHIHIPLFFAPIAWLFCLWPSIWFVNWTEKVGAAET
jgi:hypothetical protein